jgi:hypothetical protein
MPFIPINKDLIRLGDVPTNVSVDISEAIISFDVSLTLDMSSQITIQIIDKDFRFAKANYFQIRRDVFYQDLIFEITRVDVQRSSSLEPVYSIVARSKNIQLMKRDKKPESFTGQTATQFASNIAQRFNMGFFGENTIKAQTIVKARNSKNDESTWVVLERVASDNKFIVFETNNILFFTSEKNLLGKWGDPSYNFNGQKIVPFGWPEPDLARFPNANRKYVLLEMPTFGRSDDDPNEADGSLVVDRQNGRLLRPGMSIYVSGIPDFEGVYLISSVEFSEGVPDPVRISFRTPVTQDDTVAQNSGGGGGGGGENIVLPASIQNSIKEFIARNTTQNPNEKYQVHTLKYESYVKQAILLANNIWKANSVTAKQSLIKKLPDDVKNLGGVTGPVFRAIISVEQQLYQNLSRPSSSLPENIRSAIRTFFGTKLGQSTRATAFANAAYSDASLVYNKSSTNLANAQILAFRNKYGPTSLQYTVFLDPTVKRLLLAEMQPVLGVNFPDVT